MGGRRRPTARETRAVSKILALNGAIAPAPRLECSSEKCCVDRLNSPPITVHPSTSGRSVLLAYTVRTIRPSLTYDGAVAAVKPENTCAIGAASGGSTMVDLAIGNNMTDLSLSVLVQKCGEKFI